MKYTLMGIICLVFLVGAGQVWSAAPTPAELEAEAVVYQYFDALSVGDTQTIASLLGGALLEKRNSQLNSPGYANRLRSLYDQARFTVTGYQTLGSDTVTIDATIELNRQETLRLKFILKKDDNTFSQTSQYRIYREIK